MFASPYAAVGAENIISWKLINNRGLYVLVPDYLLRLRIGMETWIPLD